MDKLGPGIASESAQGGRKQISRRGILSMVVGPLDYYVYNEDFAKCPLSTRITVRRKKRCGGPTSSQTHTVVGMHEQYDPTRSEFTIFFFAESSCRNSLRVGPMVADFAHRVCGEISGDEMETVVPCQVICIPNDQETRGVEALCGGMGFWHMPFNHPNRSGIIM